MTKWETVFTEVLASMLAGQAEDIYKDWIDQRLPNKAKSLAFAAATITDEAIKTMQQLQN